MTRRRGVQMATVIGTRIAIALIVIPISSAGAQTTPAATERVSTIRGVVLGRGDRVGILAAELQVLRTNARTRTDEGGRFRLVASIGDTVSVRALGFRQRRLVVSDDSLSVTLEPLPTVLPVFTTTVGQRVIRASESPRSVTVLDQRAIAATAAVSASQLLRQIPGLQELPAPPSKTSISIRGFDNSRVLVLVDGEPVAGSLVDSRDIGRLSTLATERIEVTKGPSSVEFGSDALGGVINVVQAAPSARLSLDGQLRTGELGRQEATVGASQQLGRLGYRFTGGWRQSDRLTGYNAIGSTFNRLYDVRSDLRYAVSDRWTMRLDLQGAQERQRFPVDAQFNGFIDNHGGQGFLELSGSVGGGSVRARAFEQRFAYEYRQSRGALPIRGSADSLRQQERQGRYLLSYTRSLAAHTVDIGVQHSARTLVAPAKVDGDSARDNVNEVFARDQWTVGPVLLTAGARHTASSLWGSSTNPSVGLAWQVASVVRMRGNVARGFRAPGFKEIRYTFFNPAGGYTLVGNPNLQPETSWSSTLGGTWAPSATVSIDVEGYRNDVDGLIDWRFQGNNAAGYQVYANVNVARARTQGVETAARWSWQATAFTLGYDFLRARDLGTGLPLSRRASHTARFTAAREWRVRRGLSSDLSVRYTGNAPLIGIPIGAPITGPFSTESGIIGRQGALLSVDGQLRLMMTTRAELSVGVNNAFNQQPALWTPAFARQVYVGVRVHWVDQP
ncbi:MAG: TonB-dependent receptor [Gemmatimonadaceae bacterium]|nr:TonB-dependent receptor [Gemmatimonadaceae bacterium]